MAGARTASDILVVSFARETNLENWKSNCPWGQARLEGEAAGHRWGSSPHSSAQLTGRRSLSGGTPASNTGGPKGQQFDSAVFRKLETELVEVRGPIANRCEPQGLVFDSPGFRKSRKSPDPQRREPGLCVGVPEKTESALRRAIEFKGTHSGHRGQILISMSFISALHAIFWPSTSSVNSFSSSELNSENQT